MVFIEKLIVLQLAKKFLVCHTKRKFITVFIKASPFLQIEQQKSYKFKVFNICFSEHHAL